MLATLLVAQVVLVAPADAPRALAENDPIAVDKAAHFAVSYSLTLTGALLLEKLDLPRWQAVAIAGGATLALGFAKEYVLDDVASGGDLAADALGVGLGAGVVFVFDL